MAESCGTCGKVFRTRQSRINCQSSHDRARELHALYSRSEESCQALLDSLRYLLLSELRKSNPSKVTTRCTEGEFLKIFWHQKMKATALRITLSVSGTEARHFLEDSLGGSFLTHRTSVRSTTVMTSLFEGEELLREATVKVLFRKSEMSTKTDQDEEVTAPYSSVVISFTSLRY